MKLATTAIVLSSLLALLSIGRAGAGGSYVRVSPTSGPPGTTVELTGATWLPDADVAISMGYTADIHYGDPVTFGSKIATTRSDEDGNWAVDVVIGEDLAAPEVAGLIAFHAVSDDLPSYYEGNNTATFGLIVAGQRPNGAGGIRVAAGSAPGLVANLNFLSYRPAGSATWFGNRINAVSLPTEYTFEMLPDGDYEVAAEATGGLRPIGPGLRDIIAPVCGDPGCEDYQRIYRVKDVSVRNGEIVDVDLFFGNAESLPNGGYGPHEPKGMAWSEQLVAITGLALVGLLLAGTGIYLHNRLPNANR